MNYELDFRGADVGGPVVPGRLTEGTEDRLRWAEHVVFLLHGFNVDRQEGRAGMQALAQKLTSLQDAALVRVLWPGDHWIGPLSYTFEGRDADDTAIEFSRFMLRVLVAGTRISFVSHSLGARVILETMQRILPLGFRADQICLMAAAVDDDGLAESTEYFEVCRATRRISVLASRKDRVLQLAYPAADLLQSFFYWRRENFGQALGYHGPRPSRTHSVPINVLHYQIGDHLFVGHSDYVPDNPISPRQEDAATFCNQALRGDTLPVYG